MIFVSKQPVARPLAGRALLLRNGAERAALAALVDGRRP